MRVLGEALGSRNKEDAVRLCPPGPPGSPVVPTPALKEPQCGKTLLSSLRGLVYTRDFQRCGVLQRDP